MGAAATFHSFFLIAALLRLSGKLANRLLASILMFLSIRMGACIIGLFETDFEIVGLHLGAISFFATGPLIYSYIESLWIPSFKIQTKHLSHFIFIIPALIALLFSSVYVSFGVYLSSLVVMLAYFISTYFRFRKTSTSYKKDETRWTWTTYFISGIATLMVLFIGAVTT